MTMTLLYEAENALEAHMLVDLLAQQHLSARIDGEYLQGGVGEIQTFGLVRILIDRADYEAARAIIDAWQTNHATPADVVQETANSHPKKTVQMFKWILSCGLGFMLGAFFMYQYFDQPIYIDGIDYNQDGVRDETWFYSGERFIRAEIDRNFDGEVDMISHNNRLGLANFARLDNDFNGTFETIINYKQGSAILSRSDTNGDGFKNYEVKYQYGVVDRVYFLDKHTSQPIKVQYFNLGGLYKDEVDTDRDGTLDTVNKFDAFENIINTYEK